MRTPLCSLTLDSNSLARVRHCARGIGHHLGLSPLARVRWLTAVSTIAHSAAASGGGTLTLLLDRDSADCAGPALAAEFTTALCGAAASGGACDEDSPAVARARELVDHLDVASGAGEGVVVTLETGLPGTAPLTVDAPFRARIESLLQQPLPSPVEAVRQQDEDALGLLALVDAAESELAAVRSAHAQALGVLAHDLRSPLLTLNLSLEMLRIKPHSPAELEARREVMKRQADQLKALATGLLQAAAAGRPPTKADDPNQPAF